MNSANHTEFHVDRIGIYGTEENRQIGGALQYGGLVTYSVHAQLLGGVSVRWQAGRHTHTSGGGWRAPSSHSYQARWSPADHASHGIVLPARPPACLPIRTIRESGRPAGWPAGVHECWWWCATPTRLTAHHLARKGRAGEHQASVPLLYCLIMNSSGALNLPVVWGGGVLWVLFELLASKGALLKSLAEKSNTRSV